MYELMVMAVKHQIQTLRNPRHLIMITLNHLDAMQDYTNNPELKRSIYLAYEHLINVRTEKIVRDTKYVNLDNYFKFHVCPSFRCHFLSIYVISHLQISSCL